MANWKLVLSSTNKKVQPEQIRAWEGKSKSGALEFDDYTTSSLLIERSATPLKDRIEKYIASKKNQCGCDCCDNTDEEKLKELIDIIRENLDKITSTSTEETTSASEGTASASDEKDRAAKMKSMLEAMVSSYKTSTSTDETVLDKMKEVIDNLIGSSPTNAKKEIWERIKDQIIKFEEECCCDSNDKSSVPSFLDKMFTAVKDFPRLVLKTVKI